MHQIYIGPIYKTRRMKTAPQCPPKLSLRPCSGKLLPNLANLVASEEKNIIFVSFLKAFWIQRDRTIS